MMGMGGRKSYSYGMKPDAVRDTVDHGMGPDPGHYRARYRGADPWRAGGVVAAVPAGLERRGRNRGDAPKG
jgi:hypothetical protein